MDENNNEIQEQQEQQQEQQPKKEQKPPKGKSKAKEIIAFACLGIAVACVVAMFILFYI